MRPTALSLLLFAALAGCGTVAESPDPDASDESADADVSVDQPPSPDAADVVLAIDVVDDAQEPPDASPDAVSVDAARRDASPDASIDASRDATLDASRDAPADALRDAAIEASRDATLDAPRDAPRDVLDGGTSCPPEMVLVASRVCVDRFEASLEEISMDAGITDWSPYQSVEGHRVRAVSRGDVVPQGYISGEQAQAACRLSGKRLCRLDEWLAACRGPSLQTYPYGNTYVRRRCNEARTPHPVIQFYGTSTGVFTYARMNNPGINMLPDSLARTGQFEECVSPWGLYDMVGNLHEWIEDSGGTFKGGFYVDAEINGHGCLYTTSAHALSYHDYSTGFRCCADPM